MKPVEVRDLDVDELSIREAELKEELFNLRFQLATGQLDNHRRLREARRDIARVRTVLREREIEEYYAAVAASERTAASPPAASQEESSS